MGPESTHRSCLAATVGLVRGDVKRHRPGHSACLGCTERWGQSYVPQTARIGLWEPAWLLCSWWSPCLGWLWPPGYRCVWQHESWTIGGPIYEQQAGYSEAPCDLCATCRLMGRQTERGNINCQSPLNQMPDAKLQASTCTSWIGFWFRMGIVPLKVAKNLSNHCRSSLNSAERRTLWVACLSCGRVSRICRRKILPPFNDLTCPIKLPC